MRAKALVWVCGLALVSADAVRLAAQGSEAKDVNGSLTGKWQATAEFYGTPTYAPLQLEPTGHKLTGNLHGEKLEGTSTRLARARRCICRFQIRALLYFGDAHALQGDGELNGNALETSMDVTVTVDVIQGKHLNGPRVETKDALIAMGLGGDLDDALKGATSNMADWLQSDYKLTPSEQAEFLGVASEFHISEVADRNAGIVLKIKKSDLEKLTK